MFWRDSDVNLLMNAENNIVKIYDQIYSFKQKKKKNVQSKTERDISGHMKKKEAMENLKL